MPGHLSEMQGSHVPPGTWDATSQIDNVMDGDLDGFLNAYLTQLATGERKK